MKKSLIISAAAAAAILAGGGANAADIVTYQQQPIAPAATPTAIDWTGLYAGGTVGGSWADAGTRLRGQGVSPNGLGMTMNRQKIAGAGTNPNSFMGGIYAGYNFQIPMINNAASFMHGVVFGVETDWLFNSGTGNGKKHFGYDADGNGDAYYGASVRQKWNGSTRIRIGLPVGPEGRFMPYVAGGVSYADIRSKAGLRMNDGDGDQVYGWGMNSKTKTRVGWNIGAGVDYVPPIMNDHLVLRAEYRYTDFGKETYSWNGQPGFAGDSVKYTQSSKYYQNDFRVGVAYKF